MRLLAQAAPVTGSAVHAFVLMTNHVHLLVTGSRLGSISRLMHSVGRRYSRYVNAAQQRSGALFESRFKSSLVESRTYFLTCMRYIELNPVRAGMVEAPSAYPWSSHLANLTGSPSGLISAHAEYLALGPNQLQRAKVYGRLFENGPSDEELREIRKSVAAGPTTEGMLKRYQVTFSLGSREK